MTIASNGAAVLEQLGISAAGPGDGQPLSAVPFDLVLMDIQMPDVDGFAATAAIRRHEQGSLRKLPIVAMTAHAMKGDAERCLAAGLEQRE